MVGAVVAAVVSIAGMAFGAVTGSKARKAQERARRYSAINSYSSTVRAIQLEREDRQLAAEIATEQKAYLEDAEDLETQLQRAYENAELLKGGGPSMSPMPVEKILIPAAIAFLAAKVFQK